MLRSVTHNLGGPDPENPDKQGPTEEFELEAVGVPPYDTYPVSENKIRAEWKPTATSSRLLLTAAYCAHFGRIAFAHEPDPAH
jgi:hypothetical protein